jgi:branched-chain amino acid transport system substrate-binding protein
LQVLGEAIRATKSLDEDALARTMHSRTFHTIVGDIAFGRDGEWTGARPIRVQYHGVEGHDLAQFREPKAVTILAPAQYQTGTLIYPCAKARE